MANYTTNELKTAFAALWTTTCDNMWQAVNLELAKRLDRQEYSAFVESVKDGKFELISCMA